MSDEARSGSSIIDLAKGVTDSAFVLDTEKSILEFNRPFSKLHKIERKDLRHVKGKPCREYVNMEICETNCILRKVLESGATVRYDEVRGQNSSGDELNLIVTAVPVRDHQGEITSILEMHRDVTDEAQIHGKYKILLEKEKRAKEELERLVDERTKELQQAYTDLKRTESQLVHSEKMSSLGQMVAGIAHELNNPINFIYGNVESVEEYIGDLTKAISKLRVLTEGSAELSEKTSQIMSEEDVDYVLDDLPKIIQSIRNGSERATEIIKGLRTFSRLDEAELKEADIHEGLDTTLTLLRNEYKDRVEVHKEYGDLPQILCHPNQLNQVFMNILYNAMQAIQGEGHVWIRTRLEDENTIVEIQDSGAGIPEEVKSKIFDPFFTTKDVGKGTGLGLSISYGIIEKHGGKIEIESELNKGTTFRIVIPKRSPEDEA